MSSYNHRSASPGRRAAVASNYGRHSDLTLSSPGDASDLYRSSTDRGIPIITIPSRDSRAGDPYDDARYATHTRPRRSTFNESSRPSTVVINSAKSKAPTARPSSPLAREPAAPSKGQTKKIYAVGETQAHLIENIDLTAKRSHGRRSSVEKPKEHRKRSSVDRNGYLVVAGSRGTKEYHLTGPSSRETSSREPSSLYSYTDARGMYNDTEPVWRTRHGSVDARPDRPQSMMFDSVPRYSARDQGPPISRGIERYNEGIARSASTRHAQRPGHRSSQEDFGYSSNDEFRAPRRTSTVPVALPPVLDHRESISRGVGSPRISYDAYSSGVTSARDSFMPSSNNSRSIPSRTEERREPRTLDRAPPRTYKDASVERRGFGIRPASVEREAGRHDYAGGRPVWDSKVPPPILEPRSSHTVSRYDQVDVRPSYVAEPESFESEPRDRVERREDRRKYDDRVDDYSEQRGPTARQPGRDVEDRQRDRERDRERDQERPRDRRDEDLYDRERPRERRVDDTYDRDRDSRRERDRRRDETRGDRSDDVLATAALGAGASGIAAAAMMADDKTQRRQQRIDTHDRDSSDDEQVSRSRTKSSRRKNRKPRDESDAEDTDDERRKEREPPYPEGRPGVTSEQSLPRREPLPAFALVPDNETALNDAEEDYRRRLQQAQQEAQRPRLDALQGQDQSGRGASSREAVPETYRAANSLSGDATVNVRDHARPPVHASGDESRAVVRVSDDDRLTSSASSEGMNESGASSERRQRVRIVEPPSETEAKPRGILKKPKVQFPEDPNPVREGVAPLKDKKLSKSIPPNARWTKVSRSIINPEALEAAKERFEVRKDCLIVLRVLDDDDVQRLADLTQQIREQRERGGDGRRQHKSGRHGGGSRGHEDDSSTDGSRDSDSYDSDGMHGGEHERHHGERAGPDVKHGEW